METSEVLQLMREVSAQAIDPRFRALVEGQVMEKAPGDLVTVADQEAEQLLTAELLGAYPSAVVLGEEAFASDPALQERYRAASHAFTVDPVDGTRNFVHGSPDHAVMLSESIDGEVVRAWIWQPQHQTSYVAVRGEGAWRNDEPLRRDAVSTDPSTWRGVTSRRSLIGTSLGPTPPMELTWICCGVDYPQLIEGAADFIVYTGTRPWDHAPGSLLLREAGCHLGTFDGADYSPAVPDPAGLIAAADRATYDAVLGWR